MRGQWFSSSEIQPARYSSPSSEIWPKQTLRSTPTQFREFASGSEPTFELIKAATKHYGNTMTSTLWRLVEALDIPALGLVGSHPRGSVDPNRPAQQCRYFIRSRAFMERFSSVTEDAACAVLRAHSSFKRGGPIANGDVGRPSPEWPYPASRFRPMSQAGCNVDSVIRLRQGFAFVISKSTNGGHRHRDGCGHSFI